MQFKKFEKLETCLESRLAIFWPFSDSRMDSISWPGIFLDPTHNPWHLDTTAVMPIQTALRGDAGKKNIL